MTESPLQWLCSLPWMSCPRELISVSIVVNLQSARKDDHFLQDVIDVAEEGFDILPSRLRGRARHSGDTLVRMSRREKLEQFVCARCEELARTSLERLNSDFRRLKRNMGNQLLTADVGSTVATFTREESVHFNGECLTSLYGSGLLSLCQRFVLEDSLSTLYLGMSGLVLKPTEGVGTSTRIRTREETKKLVSDGLFRLFDSPRKR